MKGRAWTEKENLYLTKNWEKGNCSFIAKELKRSKDAIRMKAKKLGIKANDLYHLPAHFSSTQINEYEGLTMAERGYIAGMIDGEGTVSFYKNKNRGNYRDARIAIYNTNERLMKWLEKKIFGSKMHKKIRTGHAWKQAYFVRVDGTLKAKKLLSVLLPFLIVKKDIAEEILSHETRYTPNWLRLKEVMLNVGI